ncbi:MAG TPA: ABC transporter ATP-binding protein [Ilumatobacteraceae bacterium]|nr:ABC transporter ATP-binding protein [Ilumatobacteraceae bacterium]
MASASRSDTIPPPARTERPVAVRAEGLTKRYGETVAVDDLSLDIYSGEVFGLLGPNGAGKTTTILMLLGLAEPTSGSASVDGMDPTRDPLRVKSRVGYLPDDVGFYENMSGRDNLRYTAALNRLPFTEGERRVEELLALVGLSDVGDHKVEGYSRGMRQRLGLADALVKRPSILILDEPTVNIDPEGVRELLELVDRLSDEQGVTVILSSHLLHQVEQVCDRIGIFVKGRLVALGTVEELATDLDQWVFSVGVDGIDDPATVLAGVAGVVDVRPADGRLVVVASRDVRSGVHRAVTDRGGYLTHLAREGADLDAIYHRHFHEPGESRG